jgi:hypothetical protein
MVTSVSDAYNEETTEQLDWLKRRDDFFGAKAEEAEQRLRYLVLKVENRDLGQRLHEQTAVLRENMTRAYEAERRTIELEAEIRKLTADFEARLASILSSRSWKLGRAISWPVRKLRGGPA